MGEGLFQPGHLLLIMALALIVFGPGKLAGAGEALGKSIRDFRRAVRGADEPSPTSKSDVCPACGTPVSPVSAYCSSCGASLALQHVGSTNGSSTAEPPQPGPR